MPDAELYKVLCRYKDTKDGLDTLNSLFNFIEKGAYVPSTRCLQQLLVAIKKTCTGPCLANVSKLVYILCAMLNKNTAPLNESILADIASLHDVFNKVKRTEYLAKIYTYYLEIIVELSSADNTQSGLFGPILFDLALEITVKSTPEIRTESAKTLNTLLDEKDGKGSTLHKMLLTNTTVATHLYSIGQQVESSGDYELQVTLLEVLCRVISPEKRRTNIDRLFKDEELQSKLLLLKDNNFEKDGRLFLNHLNSNVKKRMVYSFHCVAAKVDNKEISLPEPWLDVNFGSGTLTMFVVDDKDTSVIDTLVITPSHVADHQHQVVGDLFHFVLKLNCTIGEMLESFAGVNSKAIHFVLKSSPDPKGALLGLFGNMAPSSPTGSTSSVTNVSNLSRVSVSATAVLISGKETSIIKTPAEKTGLLRDKRVEETRELLSKTLVPASQDKVSHLAYIASSPIQANARPDPDNGARAIKDVPKNSPTMVEDTYQENGARRSQSSQRVPESQVQMSVPESQGILDSSQKDKRSSQKQGSQKQSSYQKQSSQKQRSSQERPIKDDDWKLSSQFDHTKPSNVDLSIGDDTLEDFLPPQDETVLETKPDKFKSPKSTKSTIKKDIKAAQSPLVKYSPLKFASSEIKPEKPSEPAQSNAEMKLIEKMSKQFAAKKDAQNPDVGTIKIMNKASESTDNVIDLSKTRIGVKPADPPLSSPEDLVLLEDKSGKIQDCASPNVKEFVPTQSVPSSPGGVYQQIIDKPEKKLGFKRKLMDLDETFLNTQNCSQGSSQGSQDSASGRRNKRKTPAFAKRKSGNPVKTESFVLSTKVKGKQGKSALPNIKDLDELVPIVPRRGSILKKKFFDKPGAISSPAMKSFNFDPDSPGASECSWVKEKGTKKRGAGFTTKRETEQKKKAALKELKKKEKEAKKDKKLTKKRKKQSDSEDESIKDKTSPPQVVELLQPTVEDAGSVYVPSEKVSEPPRGRRSTRLARNRVCYKDSSSDVEEEPASVYSEPNTVQDSIKSSEPSTKQDGRTAGGSAKLQRENSMLEENKKDSEIEEEIASSLERMEEDNTDLVKYDELKGDSDDDLEALLASTQGHIKDLSDKASEDRNVKSSQMWQTDSPPLKVGKMVTPLMSSGGSSVYESHMSSPDWDEGPKKMAEDKEDNMFSPSPQETQETKAIFNALEDNFDAANFDAANFDTANFDAANFDAANFDAAKMDTSLPSTETSVNCVPSTEKQGIPLSVPSNMPSLTSIVSKDQSPVIGRTRSARKVSMKQSPEIRSITPSQEEEDVIAKYTNVILAKQAETVDRVMVDVFEDQVLDNMEKKGNRRSYSRKKKIPPVEKKPVKSEQLKQKEAEISETTRQLNAEFDRINSSVNLEVEVEGSKSYADSMSVIKESQDAPWLASSQKGKGKGILKKSEQLDDQTYVADQCIELDSLQDIGDQFTEIAACMVTEADSTSTELAMEIEESFTPDSTKTNHVHNMFSSILEESRRASKVTESTPTKSSRVTALKRPQEAPSGSPFMDYLQSMGADTSSPIKPLHLDQDDVKHTSMPVLKGDSGLGASTSIFNLSLPQDHTSLRHSQKSSPSLIKCSPPTTQGSSKDYFDLLCKTPGGPSQPDEPLMLDIQPLSIDYAPQASMHYEDEEEEMEQEEEMMPISTGSQDGDMMVNMVQKQFLENRKNESKRMKKEGDICQGFVKNAATALFKTKHDQRLKTAKDYKLKIQGKIKDVQSGMDLTKKNEEQMLRTIAQMHKTQVEARMKLQEKVASLKADHSQNQVKCQNIENVKPEIGKFQSSLQSMIKERQNKSDKENAAYQKELMMKKMAMLMMQF